MLDQAKPENTVAFLRDNKIAMDLAGYDVLMQHAQEAGIYQEVLEALREVYGLGMEEAIAAQGKELT